jgi:hypothetical protein
MWIEKEIEELENQGFDWDEVKEMISRPVAK